MSPNNHLYRARGPKFRLLTMEHMQRTFRLALFLALFVCAALPVHAAGVRAMSAEKPSDRITLSLGKSEVVAFDEDIADVMVANPDIVDIGPTKDKQLYLIGAAIGDTNVMVFDLDGNVIRQLNVHVKSDTSKLEETLKKRFPNDDIKLEAVGDQLILSGSVANADTAARVRDVAQRFAGDNQTVVNNLAVQGGQQVMIHVKVVEVSRSILNELGIETDIANSRIGSNSLKGGVSTANSMGLTVDPSFGVGRLVFNNNGLGPIELMIRALERDGLVNTLAEPNLTAISGENARFLAGGEFPIPSQRDRDGNVVYEYRPFGVSLSFRPIVLDKNRINLQVSTEVSEVSSTLTLELPGVSVPSFSVRRAETTVELASGGSIMIAGMIQSQAIQRMNKLPGIGNVPVLGALASSESFSRNESELLVMITAYTVEPIAQPSAVRVTDPARTEPLNLALAEYMARTYGPVVSTQTKGRPFGFIME